MRAVIEQAEHLQIFSNQMMCISYKEVGISKVNIASLQTHFQSYDLRHFFHNSYKVYTQSSLENVNGLS